MSPGWARTRGDALGQHGKVRRCHLEPNVEQGKARWHQQGHEAWELGHHRERRCWKRRERGKRAETFPGSTGSTLGRSSAVPGGLWTTQLGHSSVPSLVPPACQGTRVTQRVTQPPQPQPATKLSFQSGFRLTRAPKSPYREGPVPRSRLGTPAAPAGPAQQRCQAVLARLTCSNTPRHSPPAAVAKTAARPLPRERRKPWPGTGHGWCHPAPSPTPGDTKVAPGAVSHWHSRWARPGRCSEETPRGGRAPEPSPASPHRKPR